MTSRLNIAIAAMLSLASMSSAEASVPSCLPSLLALSASPIGTMHPGKSKDRPVVLDASPSVGLAAMWWCADGTVWEYHVTPSALAKTWGTPRVLQWKYVSDPVGMRAAVGPSCFGSTSKSAECYPTTSGGKICGNTQITDASERALCTVLLKQVSAEWPK